jgi:hypothetical protein
MLISRFITGGVILRLRPAARISLSFLLIAVFSAAPVSAKEGKTSNKVTFKRKSLSQGTFTGKAVPRYALQAKLTKRVVTCAYSQEEELIVSFDPVSDPLSSTTTLVRKETIKIHYFRQCTNIRTGRIGPKTEYVPFGNSGG